MLCHVAISRPSAIVCVWQVMVISEVVALDVGVRASLMFSVGGLRFSAVFTEENLRMEL